MTFEIWEVFFYNLSKELLKKLEERFTTMPEDENCYQEEALKYFQEGYEKHAQGQLEDAIGLYKKSIGIYPTPEAHTFLGWAYSFQSLYQEAIEECQRAIALDPDYGNPYNDIGAYLMEIGKCDDAIDWFEKAAVAKRYESHCYPLYNLGRVWEQKGDWNKALEYYRNALRENPDYTLAKSAVSRLQGMMN